MLVAQFVLHIQLILTSVASLYKFFKSERISLHEIPFNLCFLDKTFTLLCFLQISGFVYSMNNEPAFVLGCVGTENTTTGRAELGKYSTSVFLVTLLTAVLQMFLWTAFLLILLYHCNRFLPIIKIIKKPMLCCILHHCKTTYCH